MFANKVLQAITNTGTGAYQLNTTGTGAWKTWRAMFSTGAQVAYYAENATGTIWEYGYGTLTTGTPDQISRNYVLSSTGALIDWASGDGTVYVMSVPWSQAMEGRWDATNAMFVAAGRRPWTAVGAANKTVTASDAGGRFSLDTTAAARSVILPAISAVSMGFNVEVYGLNVANNINITPAGSDTVDGGSGGAALAVPGNWVVNIFSDGTGWRTNYRYNAQTTTTTAAQANNSTALASTAYVDRVGVQQVVTTTLATVATGTTTIPFDDTIPQSAEGDEYLTRSITPKSTTSKLVIEAVINVSPSTPAGIAAALFQDANANALAATYTFTSTAYGRSTLYLRYEMAAGTTSATTFKLRAGMDTAGTLTVNGSNGARLYGGVMRSSLTVTEIGI